MDTNLETRKEFIDRDREGSGPSSHKPLLEALRHWVTVHPDKSQATWVDDAGKEVVRLSYKDVDEESGRLAGFLLSSGRVRRGDPVLLVYPPGLDFIVAFLACLRAGLIAVPVYPPEAGKAQKDLRMFVAVQSSSGAKVALTTFRYCQAKQLDDLRSFFVTQQSIDKPGSWPDIEWLPTDTYQARNGPAVANEESPHCDDIAFLQYTSGSTSEPKGVMITHANLSANLQAIITALKAGTDTVVASWLPQYHDMGLIGSYLGALYCGGSGYYMSPVTFVRKPSLWIQVMSRCRATHIQAPNFAYGLTARKFHPERDAVAGLDLSSVRHMINGAEPVDGHGMEAFYTAFHQYGLRRDVIYPTYGLAENTVLVASNGRHRIRVDRKILESKGEVVERLGGDLSLVGCGDAEEAAKLGIEIVVVDTETREKSPDGRLGEIWVRGPSRAVGYYGREEQSRATFGARIKGSSNEDAGVYHHKGRAYVSPTGFLRTGDQGFLWRGEVFITGRIKDLIIIRGRNMYPQDLERSVEAALAHDIRGGCSAAFAMRSVNGANKNDEGEIMAFAAEVKDPSSLSRPCLEALGLAIRRILAQEQGAAVSILYLLKPRTIPKTTSGKIARSWVRKAAEEGRLQTVLTWAAREEEEEEGSKVVDDKSRSPMAGVPGGRNVLGPIHGSEDPQGGKGDAKDVDGMSLEEVVEVLKKEVARITKDDVSTIPADAPLASLGLDSLQGMQLHSLLEERFRMAVPESVMFEKDLTLTALGHVIKRHGVVPTPVTLVDLARMATLQHQEDQAAGGRGGGRKPQMKRKQRAGPDALSLSTSRSSLLTGRFPHHHLRTSAHSSLSMSSTRIVLFFLRLLISPLPYCIATAAVLLALLSALTSLPIALLLAVPSTALLYYAFPFPPAFLGSSSIHTRLSSLLFRFFSFKVAYEGAGLPGDGPLQLVLVKAAPHPLPTIQVLLSLAFPIVFSRPLTCIISNPPRPPHNPLLSGLLRALEMKPPSLLPRLLDSGKCVAVCAPGDTGVLDTASRFGAPIVPCLVFTTPSATFTSRTPVTVIIGAPILTRQDDASAGEMMAAKRDTQACVLAEARRLFDQHKMAWGLDETAELVYT